MVSYILLLLFMHSFLSGVRLNFIPFWLAIPGIFAPIVYQIYRFSLTSSTKFLILFEIALIVLFLNLVQIMLWHNLLTTGGDAYVNLIAIDSIKTYGGTLTSSVLTTDKWPGLQLISIVISEVGGIKLYDIALFSPLFYQILAVIFAYLFIKELYNERVALLACTIFAPFQYLWIFNSQFRPEILAYVFLFLCIFAYTRKINEASTRLRFSLLALLFIICLVITHPATTVVIVSFFVVMLLVFESPRLPKLKNQARGVLVESPLPFALFAIVIWLAYWMYIGEPFFVTLVEVSRELYTPVVAAGAVEQLGYVPRVPLLKEVVLGRVNAFYLLLFMGLMAYEIFKRRDCKTWLTDFWVVGWVAFTVSLYFVLGERPGMVFPQNRIHLFSYPFVLMAVSHTITQLGSVRKKILFNTLLVGFALLNIFSIQFIPLSPLSSSSPFPLAQWDTTQDLKVAEWIEPGEGSTIVFGGMSGIILRYMKKGSVLTQDIAVFDDNMKRLKGSTWLVLNPNSPGFVRRSGAVEAGVTLDEETLSKIPNTTWLQKVYTNGKIEIYRITP